MDDTPRGSAADGVLVLRRSAAVQRPRRWWPDWPMYLLFGVLPVTPLVVPAAVWAAFDPTIWPQAGVVAALAGGWLVLMFVVGVVGQLADSRAAGRKGVAVPRGPRCD